MDWVVVIKILGLFLATALVMRVIEVVVRLIIRTIAMRIFGWRPAIFNREMANEVAEDSVLEIITREPQVMAIMTEELRETLEHYSYWVIEHYTARFSYSMPRADKNPPLLKAPDSFAPRATEKAAVS